MTSGGRVLVWFLRRDLRVADNPILHHLANTTDHGFTHLLPIYVFPAHQIEVSGFSRNNGRSPYPSAVSQVGGFWRCGPHRAKFVAQTVWDLRSGLADLGSSLTLRVGHPDEVLSHLIKTLDKKYSIASVWMTKECSSEEIEEERDVAAVCKEHGVDLRLWTDEKYFVDDRDTGLESAKGLPDVFTSYKKTQMPLRSRPRQVLPRPNKNSLPPPLDAGDLPPQDEPFVIPSTYAELEKCLLSPLTEILKEPPALPQRYECAHPFNGGESAAQERLHYLLKHGKMTSYQDTRNGLVGTDFSTKLGAFLALGSLTARQIHHAMVAFEDGEDDAYQGASGYGKGENDGTKGVRYELLWRDYMRLCTQKFGQRLFSIHGFRAKTTYKKDWLTADTASAPRNQKPSATRVAEQVNRFLEGTTGMGLIDAAQRELYHTGYTSNRTRQNVASFLAKHLGIDWRYGAEWYESMLVDYDVHSNWANWQYVAGVGNDPRGDTRIFNPVKQACDYDKDGSYVRMWVPELRYLETRETVFQACTAKAEELEKCGLLFNIMVTDPLKRIEFTVDLKPKGNRGQGRGRGSGPHGRGGGSGRGGGPNNHRGDGHDGGPNSHGGGRGRGPNSGRVRNYGNGNIDHGGYNGAASGGHTYSTMAWGTGPGMYNDMGQYQPHYPTLHLNMGFNPSSHQGSGASAEHDGRYQSRGSGKNAEVVVVGSRGRYHGPDQHISNQSTSYHNSFGHPAQVSQGSWNNTPQASSYHATYEGFPGGSYHSDSTSLRFPQPSFGAPPMHSGPQMYGL